MPTYVRQTAHARGFWMSFHELVSGYPWLTRRAALIMGEQIAGTRHPLAWLPALMVPYGGRLGPAFSFLVLVYVIIIAAAVAVPRRSSAWCSPGLRS